MNAQVRIGSLQRALHRVEGFQRSKSASLKSLCEASLKFFCFFGLLQRPFFRPEWLRAGCGMLEVGVGIDRKVEWAELME
jgi:hypothetical protein